jgi:hypothetical protein
MLNNFRLWNFNRILKNSTKVGDYHRFGQIVLQKVGVIIDTEIDIPFNELQKNVKALFGSNANYNFLYFIPQKKKMVDSEHPYYCLDDINWSYIPNNNEISEFLSTKYDVLILLSFNIKPHLKYIVTKADAIFKAGYTGTNDAIDLFDIGLESKPVFNSFIKELDKSIKIITNTSK